MRHLERSRRKRPGESDKILRFAVAAVLLLFLVAGIVVAVRLMNPRVDATEGRKRLEEVASADVQEIDAKIQKLEAEERKEKREAEDRSYNEIFAGLCFWGTL